MIEANLLLKLYGILIQPEDFSDEERILDYYYNQQRSHSHSNSLLSNKSSSEEVAGGKIIKTFNL